MKIPASDFALVVATKDMIVIRDLHLGATPVLEDAKDVRQFLSAWQLLPAGRKLYCFDAAKRLWEITHKNNYTEIRLLSAIEQASLEIHRHRSGKDEK